LWRPRGDENGREKEREMYRERERETKRLIKIDPSKSSFSSHYFLLPTATRPSTTQNIDRSLHPKLLSIGYDTDIVVFSWQEYIFLKRMPCSPKGHLDTRSSCSSFSLPVFRLP